MSRNATCKGRELLAGLGLTKTTDGSINSSCVVIISKQGVMTCVDITVMMKCMNIIRKGVKYTNGNEIVDTQGKLSTTLPTSPTVSCSWALSATLGRTAPTPTSASLGSTLYTEYMALRTSDTSGVVCPGCDPASLTC